MDQTLSTGTSFTVIHQTLSRYGTDCITTAINQSFCEDSDTTRFSRVVLHLQATRALEHFQRGCAAPEEEPVSVRLKLNPRSVKPVVSSLSVRLLPSLSCGQSLERFGRSARLTTAGRVGH